MLQNDHPLSFDTRHPGVQAPDTCAQYLSPASSPIRCSSPHSVCSQLTINNSEKPPSKPLPVERLVVATRIRALKGIYFVPATLQNPLSLICMRILQGGFFLYTVTEKKKLKLKEVTNLGKVAHPVLVGTEI